MNKEETKKTEKIEKTGLDGDDEITKENVHIAIKQALETYREKNLLSDFWFWIHAFRCLSDRFGIVNLLAETPKRKEKK